jgi:putative ABC transport system permease protein
VLVFKNLLRRRARSVLSLLGIALGIAAIIAFHAVGRGFKDSLERYMHESGAEMLVVNRAAVAPEYSRVQKEGLDFVRSLPEVEHVSPGTFTIVRSGALKIKTVMKMLFVFGRLAGDRPVEKFRGKIEGRLYEKDDEMILGADAAHDLRLKVGDALDLYGRTFRIVGVYKSKVRFEAAGCIVSLGVVQQQLNMGDATSLAFIYLKPGADWKKVRDAIDRDYSSLQAIRTDEFTSYYDQIEYIDWFVWIVTLISVAVGGLGVLNTMLMAVSERTREIGTLRALGWSRGRVIRMILAEGTLISSIGGVLGLAAGAAGAEVLIRWAPRGLDTLYTPLLFAEGFGIAVVLGFAGALYPAWQASRLSPIEALKYE